MPLGPFGEIMGTTGTLQSLPLDVKKYRSHVVAPRNPKLVRHSELDTIKMTPSKFMFEMSLSTEQKLANTHIMKVPRKIELLDMGDTSLQKFSKVHIDEPMFQPFPSEIYFQNFKPFEVYEVPLTLRNNDKVPRLIKVTQEKSPYFNIISPSDVGHKVGPGLPTTFRIQFTPDENKDYEHELVCISEREKFTIPIKAIGARGILDFPDTIHFPSCLVKYPNTKTLLVRNIGGKEAIFSLKVKQPFSVSPDIGALGVNESIQVTVEFKPLTVGDHKESMRLTYDTGEEIFISLYGAAHEANIRLDKNSIRVENTYISMASQRSVVIMNHSDIIAHFRWSKFATQDDEDQQRLLQQIELDREENNDTDTFLEECVTDPMLRDKLSILSRTFQNRKRAVENNPFVFQDDIVSIDPVEGDIWPNSTMEVTVVFRPREAITYTHTAYCDISGRESRLPLRIRGDGMGPKVDFSFEHLEMGNIFIGSKHIYEVVIANKGDIDAIYSVIPNNSIFGPCFAFNPAEGIVMPGGHQAIEVAFCSPYLGDFEEIFCFQVDGQPQQSTVKFSGRVMGPTFNFDVAKLKFGTVPFGFQSSQVCNLINTSLVPMVFKLRIPGDGTNKSICCRDDVEEAPLSVGPPPAVNPQEFTIIPSCGVISPKSQVKVTVHLIPNTVRKYEVALVVDVERVGEEIISLPITARSLAPEITNAMPILNYGRCFLRFPYEHQISLHNDTDLEAKYEIVRQNENRAETDPVSYRSPKPKGIIPAQSVVDVPLVIQANILGEQEIVCFVNIFGDPNPLTVNIVCVGEGPVVHFNPHFLDWGDIPVLMDNEKILTLSNESFIPAQFEARLLKPNTVFRVTPTKGEIPAQESIQLKVIVNLEDCIRFQDKLVISVSDSQVRQIPLHASGKGTTITSNPPLGPVLNLGPNFSNRLLRKHFTLTNRGRRIQQLVWLTDGFHSTSRAKREKKKSSDINIKAKQSGVCVDGVVPVFQLVPNRMELSPGESADLVIEGFVQGPQIVSETVVCHAIIGRAGGKVPIISVNVRAEFIEPLLNFSTKCAFFRVDKEPNQELEVQTKQVVMNNVSSLPLTVGLKLAYPFSIVSDGMNVYDTTVCLQSGDVHTVTIEFDPKFKDDRYVRTIDEVLHITYKEHPHVDYIALRGEVYFPNLEFEKTNINFGCILNDTEVTRYINITNTSPLQVCYRWSFLVGDVQSFVRKMRSTKPKKSSSAMTPEEPTDAEEEEELTKDDDNVKSECLLVEEEDTDTDKIEESAPETAEVSSLDVSKKEDAALEDNKNIPDPYLSITSEVDVPEKGQLDQEGKLDEENEKGTERKPSAFSQLSLLENEEECLRRNQILSYLLEEEDDDTVAAIGVEEVFDILPLYGCLQPGQTEQVTFTFYGHADILGEVLAVCTVEDGPSYELKLSGEASLLEYAFSSKVVDFGRQMYDIVATTTITLINTGKVGFNFTAINMDPRLETRPLPGQPIMVPHSGFIEPFAEQKLEIRFLPGIPDFFEKTFQIQVAHFKPDTITVYGEGVFPRVSLDLPRLEDNAGLYASLLKEARENLKKIITEQHKIATLEHSDDIVVEDIVNPPEVEELGDKVEEEAKEKITQPSEPVLREPTELELQMEVERLAVKNHVQQNEADLPSVASFILDKGNNHVQTVNSDITACSFDAASFVKTRPHLPDYVLDFGYVVLGTVRSHVIRATNTGWFPVSFKLDRHALIQTGFRTELDRVRNLPGAPDNETLDFVISFDPRSANVHLGPVEVVVPITIVKGPVINLRLRAHVTMPDMKVSDDVLHFGEVKCGECKVITIQLHNYQMVKCEWDATPPDDRKKVEKHVPMHLRRKIRQGKKQPSIFELLPPTGILLPGQKINVQVKFMPTEEKTYENRIQIRISQSSQRILLMCHGQGLEPRLDFECSLLQFDPILPHSVGDEQQVVVHNPCPFPIEFYSLEFDRNYLYEERVLRLMRGYDEFNTLLLPPREVNEKLPYELLNYYDEHFKKVEEEENIRMQAEAQLAAEIKKSEDKALEEKQNEEREKLEKEFITDVFSELASAVSKSKSQNVTPIISSAAIGTSLVTEVQSEAAQPIAVDSAEELLHRIEDLLEEKMKKAFASGPGVGELEITPVSAAIARYLGIDLTSEGKAARNRRGIAIIVQGAPLSGKTDTAIALAKHYGAALLTVDGVVCDAIASGNTAAGLKARELCSLAAKKVFYDSADQETLDGDKKGGLSVEAVTAHTQAGIMASRKVSMYSDQKSKLTGIGKTTHVTSSVEGASQMPSSPPLVLGPVSRKLSISASIAGEEGLVSCVLPDDLLVTILAERLQLNDCYCGVVFDGLETLFSQSYLTTASAILKALNNRRFIYFCTLKLDFNVLKEQEEKAKKIKDLEEQEKERAELKMMEEMDEEEYDALPDEVKAKHDKKMLLLKKDRIKRDMEKAEKERLEREAREEEEKRKEEERTKGKGRKLKAADSKKNSGIMKSSAQEAKKSSVKVTEGEKGPDRPDSVPSDKSNVHGEKKKGKKDVKHHIDHFTVEEQKDPTKDPDFQLMQRFSAFEAAQKDIQDLLELWDRSTLQLRQPLTPSDRSEEELKDVSSKKSKAKEKMDKERLREQERLKQEKEVEEKASKGISQGPEEAGNLEVEEEKKEETGIPNIIIDCANKTFVKPLSSVKSDLFPTRTQPPEAEEVNNNALNLTIGEMLLQSDKLPSVDTVLDGLGLGPQGPPIPPPVTFSVVPYPVKRRPPLVPVAGGQYIFVASSPDDPNVGPDKETASEVKDDDKAKLSKNTEKSGRISNESKSDRKRSADRKKQKVKPTSSNLSSPQPGQITPVSDVDGCLSEVEELVPAKKLTLFRWTVPAQGVVTLRLRFTSNDIGQFDQTMNFEIVGTRRRYQIFCRGICAFPTISKDPRVVFASRKKNRGLFEIVHKKYILATDTFEFGPLLVGKSRESYREAKYPENMEPFTILNTSPMEADVSFCFLHDSRGETFMLEPASVILKPGESSKLLVWAYPRGPGHYEDVIVCCMRENPEPILFKISCDGFRPELDLDKKVLQFDKMLLHRKDTKTIFLQNNTQLPVAWKLSGLENLGDEITVAADSGIVEPLSEYPLHAYFRAMKATSSKKMIRIEISDADNILGVVQTESIQISAEAYDVALDMSFPKGTDGGLDFGIIKVNEDAKQLCTLKNKGRYEITFNFILENLNPKRADIASLFNVVPKSGKLNPVDKPTQVQVIFKSSREITIKDMPILKCQVIEPNLGEKGEIIASIPVRVSAKVVFSKFVIAPANDMNFGALIVGSRKTRTFCIENRGEFDFRFIITKKDKDPIIASSKKSSKVFIKGDKSSRSIEDVKTRKTESLRQDTSASKIIAGMFTIFPAFGIILPKGNQVITVECIGEVPGKEIHDIFIEITDRDPNMYKGGVPYQLIAEACIPGISTDNVGSIFEEHRVCKNLSVWQHINRCQVEVGGVYGEEEKKFIFNNVIVGRPAKARFKISNPYKVPCDVGFTLKQVAQKGALKSSDVFDLDPPRAQIANNSHMYVTVTFTPQAMLQYSAMFEAYVEGLPQSLTRGKSLTFEISGEGNLPRITVSKPAVRNRRGQPLLMFKRILIGRSESLPLELLNEGTLPSKVNIDLVDPDNCFVLKPTKETRLAMGDDDDDENEMRKRPHTASVVVNIMETATFEVIYQPQVTQRSQANLKITVVDNQYEDSIVQMVGEGFQDDITLDNIGSVPTIADVGVELDMADDEAPVARSNLMQFGDCYINDPRTLNLTMTNHSKTDCIRFQWPDHPHLRFSPQVGHLHANCMKDVAVTFCSATAETYIKCPVMCQVTKITFDKPIDQVCDWDDKLQVVNWVDNPLVARQSLDSGSKSTAIHQSAKQKVVETEKEPEYTEVADVTRSLELLVSAVSDFARGSCEVTAIHFKDTLMFQTRVYSITLENVGQVALEYCWQLYVQSSVSTRPQSSLSYTFWPAAPVETEDQSNVPFIVVPDCGTIPAGKSAECVVKFSPLDAKSYEGKLICSIPFKNPLDASIVIELKGRSRVPYCHFELEDSDYISSARRNPELRGPGGAPPGSALDPNTRVVEFNVCGIGVKTVKEFGIVNPTNYPYMFEWICEDESDPKRPSHFTCIHKEGEIRSGRKFKVGFEFVSRELDIVESFWRLVIPSESISLPFLLVGNTREPQVCLDRSHLNFKSLLVGYEAKETVYLTNREDTWFSFTFDENSCHSEGYAAHLKVVPMHGQISANSSIPIDLYFTPSSEKEVNFNLHCKVARKMAPLTLNVKAEGYSMNSVLFYEDAAGVRTELTDNELHVINFGEVEVSENIIRHLFILNPGKFNFDYVWELSEAPLGPCTVSITPLKGSVECGETQNCSLVFCPHKRMSLKDCQLQLKVINGKTYKLFLTGFGVRPGLQFSFLTYDFGNCFVHKMGLDLPPKQAVLHVRNKDKKEISLSCLYEPTSQLIHHFETRVLAPNKEIKIPFTFCPRQAKKYHEVVTFEINGLSKQTVEFSGTGTEMKIEVVDPKHKSLNLGARMVGDSVRKFIPIVNNSHVPVTFSLAFTPTEPALQVKDVLIIGPKEPITLAARGGSAKVEVWFKPTARIPQFAEEVLLECSGMSQPLFVIKGSCLGLEVSLDSDAISFGTVFLRSSSSRKLLMSNTGDMNTKFRWDMKHFKPDFSINPVDGFITPGMNVTFQVDFHPQTVCPDVRYEKLKCFLDGGPHKPITLTLTGSCTGIPAVKEVQSFQAAVRQTDTKQIMIPNKSNQLWNLKPIIDGEYWTGPLTFTVEPQQTKAYELTYKPLTMTSENKKHVGSIFFPLPDGSGLLFNLSGTADPPRVVDRIFREVPCKTSYTELLPVTNWLKIPQRFHVKIEPLKEKFDPGITVKGVEYIDVPSNGKKDYKLTFFAYKEGVTPVKVTFTNEQTGEYQFYEVSFRAIRPGTMAKIELSTPVRQTVHHVVSVENPLPNQVNFNIMCSVAEVLVPSQFSVPPKSQGQFSFEYQPLKVGVVPGHLELNSIELGLYTYDLVLTATPGAPEKAVYFRTNLGSAVSQVTRFLNFAKQKTDYNCKIENPDFHVEKTVAAAPASTGGTEVALDVSFEPSVLGEQRAMLLISSPMGGDYTIPLFGTCDPPKPQGPFTIKAGTSIPIIFKNVFNTTTQFTFQVDNPLFHLTKQSESIRSHKEQRIVVSFDGSDVPSKAAVMGKLFVSCAHSAGSNSSIQWMYYLKGVSQ